MLTVTLADKDFGVILDSLWTRYYHCETQMKKAASSFARQYWAGEVDEVEGTINNVLKATHEA